MLAKKTSPWYIGGLHFECRKCGKCCSGPQEGIIWVSRPEIKLLAERLGLSTSELRKKYLKRLGFHLSIQENPQTKDCIFLKNINGFKGCTIYDVRPTQCRNWPFWPANLDSPDDWNAAAMKCPGINPAPIVPGTNQEKNDSSRTNGLLNKKMVRDSTGVERSGFDFATTRNNRCGANKGRLYAFDEIQKIKNQKQWWVNTNQIICDEVKKIYDWLDSNIKSLNNQCAACGKCCNFESFGHKLFVTTPELLYFSKNVKNLRPMLRQQCPYLENGKCTIRNYRFAGCRIFFCRADKNLQNNLSEETVKKFKALCDKFSFPYRYIDLTTALNSSEIPNLIES